MRPLLVLILAAAIFGTLAGYEFFVATLPQASEIQDEVTPATGKFAVEIMLSFDAAKDAFALSDDPALLVRMGGHELIRRDERATAGELLRADDVPGIVSGRNAFLIRAVPDEASSTRPNAVQVRILRDEEVIAENTLWSQAGNPVAGEVLVEVK
jgi:hypothetical protein